MRRHWISVAYLQKFTSPKHMDALIVSFAFIREKHMDGWSEKQMVVLGGIMAGIGQERQLLAQPA